MGCFKLTYTHTKEVVRSIPIFSGNNLDKNGYAPKNDLVYYPFGMQIGHRSDMGADFRFGFQGMERDDEIKGNGSSYTTEFRQYDPRLGKWLTIDPLTASFPWQSPYAAFDNNPIRYVDPRGLAAGEPKNSNPHGAPIAKEGDLTPSSYRANSNWVRANKKNNFVYRNEKTKHGYSFYWVPNDNEKNGGSYYVTPYVLVNQKNVMTNPGREGIAAIPATDGSPAQNFSGPDFTNSRDANSGDRLYWQYYEEGGSNGKTTSSTGDVALGTTLSIDLDRLDNLMNTHDADVSNQYSGYYIQLTFDQQKANSRSSAVVKAYEDAGFNVKPSYKPGLAVRKSGDSKIKIVKNSTINRVIWFTRTPIININIPAVPATLAVPAVEAIPPTYNDISTWKSRNLKNTKTR